MEADLSPHIAKTKRVKIPNLLTENILHFQKKTALLKGLLENVWLPIGFTRKASVLWFTIEPSVAREEQYEYLKP